LFVMHSSPPSPTTVPGLLLGSGLDDAFDAGALAQLRQLDPQGRNKLLERVLGAYAQSLQKLLAQMPVNAGQQDSDTVRQLVHSLKSSSASVGALPMADLCNQIERAVRDGHLAQWQSQMGPLRSQAERLLQALSNAGIAVSSGNSR
jgi:HPt (histidine-containing phosphotransfer) domain-containing protein